MRSFVPDCVKLMPKQARRVFKGVIFDVYQWEQELFDGTRTTFEMLKRPDTVRIIAIKEGKIVVLEQEQPSFGLFYDLPSGRHDVETENELAAAKRETLEETGMIFSTWKLLDVEQPQTKIDWLIYTFLANDFVSETEQKLDAGERITVTLKTFDEVKGLLNNPKVRYLARNIFDKVSSLDELAAVRIQGGGQKA